MDGDSGTLVPRASARATGADPEPRERATTDRQKKTTEREQPKKTRLSGEMLGSQCGRRTGKEAGDWRAREYAVWSGVPHVLTDCTWGWLGSGCWRSGEGTGTPCSSAASPVPTRRSCCCTRCRNTDTTRGTPK